MLCRRCLLDWAIDSRRVRRVGHEAYVGGRDGRRTDSGELSVELGVATDNRGLFNGATATEIKIPS